MKNAKNILLIEPFFTASHRRWATEYANFSQHNIELLTLSGRHWKWRMHGGAVTLARLFQEKQLALDLILATDMLDLTTFLSLTRRQTAHIPTALYFHENQLTYPWSPNDADVRLKRDNHYSFINYISALAADLVLFNSNYHFQSFINALPTFLHQFPDYKELNTVSTIQNKSRVLPLGMDLQKFDAYQTSHLDADAPALLLWNHRWEYDKNPDDFFKALNILQSEGLDFEVIILGEKFKKTPKIFEQAQQLLGKRIRHMGYVPDFSEYARWLWQADILPVTAHQDFFGGSVVEAIYCQTTPLLPYRLAYPEHLPKTVHSTYFYTDFQDFVQKLRYAIQRVKQLRQQKSRLQSYVARYDWRQLVGGYDGVFGN